MTSIADDARDGAEGSSSPLAELVVLALDRLEREGPAALEALCREHPAQAVALRERVGRLAAVGFLGGERGAGLLPERIGDFRVLGHLGAGGMGVVLLAEQEGLGRRVALKLVRPDLLHFPGARERFRREVSAIARLAHPGIVPVYAGGEDGGIPYYAMERVRGASLDELVAALAGRDPARLSGAEARAVLDGLVAARDAAAPIDARRDAAAPVEAAQGVATRVDAAGGGTASGASPRASGSSASAAQQLFAGSWTSTCLRIARAVAEALQHAHEQGVLHRDVKPSNIMLTHDGRVLLLDFGLAAAEGSERLTGSGAALGSLAWMSPEQVRGERDGLDGRTDVYSLAATLYELLSLRSPFAGGDLEETRRRVLEGRLIPLRDLNGALSRDAETVCLVALDIERARRYPSAAAFADDLLCALEQRPVAGRRPGTLHRLRRWSSRNRARAAASLLAVLVVVGGPFGYALLESRAADAQRLLNDELARGRAELEGVLGELQRSLADETLARQASQRDYERALGAVEQMLWQVGSEDLENLPGFEDVRRSLLERALAFYAELAAEQPADRAPRLESLRTLRSMGDILMQLGRPDEAQAQLEDVVAGARRLLVEAPGDAEATFVLAATLSQLGTLALSTGDLARARAQLEEAHAAGVELATRPDPLPTWLRNEASVEVNLALVADASGDDEGEYAFYRSAAETSARLVEVDPESVDYAMMLAGALRGAATSGLSLGHGETSEEGLRTAYTSLAHLLPAHPQHRELRGEFVQTSANYGLLLLTRADRSLALEVLTAGHRVAEGLVADFPRDPIFRHDCAGIGVNLAAELGNQRRFDEGARVIEESVAQLERLHAELPDSLDALYFLGAALSVASGMHLALGDDERALREAQQSVGHLRECLALLPGSSGMTIEFASALYQYADVLRARGALRDALDLCRLAAGMGVRRADVLFQGAEIVGRLLSAVRNAEGEGDPSAPSSAETGTLCLDLLEDAVENGFSDVSRLAESEFADLAGTPRFEEIVARAGPRP